MVLRHLYLRIYLTMLAALLIFALVAGLLVRRHSDAERARFEAAIGERTAAWANLLGNSLPPTGATQAAQQQSLQEWSQRLRLPMALDDSQGRRIATSDSYARLESSVDAAPADSETAARAVNGEVLRSAVGQRIPLDDGRGLWVGTVRSKPGLGGLDLPPPWVGPPGRLDGGPPPRGPAGDDGPRPWGPQAPPQDIAEPGGSRVGAASAALKGPDGERRRDKPSHWHPARWIDEAGVLLMLLAVLFLAVAAGSYPVVRRLTRRLEALQRGVEVFGSGQLGHRVPADGTDEVAVLARSFNEAADRVETLVQSNRSLLANASHELRSPLARLKMALAMQASASAHDDPAHQLQLRREIDRNIHELDALVEEVLMSSRLDAGRPAEKAPVDLLGLLAEEASRVDAEVDGVPLTVTADERLLRRALRNLLENARRYGGTEVTAVLQRLPDGGAELRICDRGPGVPAAYRERVFEPFFRLPGHAEREGGVGLGLSLVRQIAQQHGGSVHCEARDGGGGCFVLRLPASV